jgi:hypothetical protein
MLSKDQIQNIFQTCANINAINKEDLTLVFCWRLQEWVHIEQCKCRPNNRIRASMEW